MPTFRVALAMEKEEWKPFRNALDKSDRKKFDEMWEIPKVEQEVQEPCPSGSTLDSARNVCVAKTGRGNR